VAAAIGATLLVTAVAPAAGGAKVGARPDLTVSRGTIQAANGALTGSFVIRNKGLVEAGRSSAALIIRASGKSRVAKRFRLHELGASASHRVKVAVGVPSGLPSGPLAIRVCADKTRKVRERSERNNCRTVGSIDLGTGSNGPAGKDGPAGPKAPSEPPSSVPTDPISFSKSTVFTLNSSETEYWVYVPNSYDASHSTPTTLFVWLHGCSGFSAGDIYIVDPGGSQDWISIAVGGREGECWNPNTDQSKVLAAIANMKTHFNVNPRRVILGGYSSGGDLTYRTAFYNASSFAGILVENSSPFRDTGSSQSESLAAASWKFNVVHLAHKQDAVYPIAGVKNETNAMTSAGFPLTLVEATGTHYDEPAAMVAGESVPGTSADLNTYLLPHIDDGWLSPP
jgi:dienelactone hydrolase